MNTRRRPRQRVRARLPPARRAGPALLLATALVLSATSFRLVEAPETRPWHALAAWAAAILVFLGAAWLLERSAPPRTRSARWPACEVGLVITLTVLALVVRGIALESVPANFGGDEGEMGEQARAVLAGELDHPFTTGWLGHPTLWFFAQALSLAVLGNDVAGLRALSALLGAATVPALYWLARSAYGPTVALLASTLLVGYHFHIHFSRLGLNNVTDPFLVVVGFAAFVSGYRTRSRLGLAVAGVALGLAQHGYAGARLAPFVILAALVHQAALDRRRLADAAAGLALAVAGFVLAYGPLVRVPLFHWQDFQARAVVEGIFQSGWYADRLAEGGDAVSILWEQVWRSLGAITSVPLRGPFYEPGMPLLEPVWAVLFLIGVAVALGRWRRMESALFAAWLLGVTLVGGALFVNPPQAHHLISIAPLLCVLVASGLNTVGCVVSRSLHRAGSALRWLTPLAAAGLASWSAAFYFWDYTPRRNYSTWTSEEVAEYLAPRAETAYVYFFAAPFMYLDHGTIRFVARPTGTDVIEPLTRPSELPPHPLGRRPIFVFLPERAGELAVVRRAYPKGSLRFFSEGPGTLGRFVAYEPDATS